MKRGNNLKPQDILVLLKILTSYRGKRWKYADLSKALDMSVSEVHSALKRAEFARLYDPMTKLPIRSNLLDFLIYGVRYAFPAIPGKRKVGIPTAHSAAPLNKEILSSAESTYIWPSRRGKVEGISIEPFYRTVPTACAKDEALHELCALIDALRVGRAREINLAKKHLETRIKAA